MKDGTVYRPFRWHFDDGGLVGLCPQCEANEVDEELRRAAAKDT
jgi:hypothetical protein